MLGDRRKSGATRRTERRTKGTMSGCIARTVAGAMWAPGAAAKALRQGKRRREGTGGGRWAGSAASTLPWKHDSCEFVVAEQEEQEQIIIVVLRMKGGTGTAVGLLHSVYGKLGANGWLAIAGSARGGAEQGHAARRRRHTLLRGLLPGCTRVQRVRSCGAQLRHGN